MRVRGIAAVRVRYLTSSGTISSARPTKTSLMVRVVKHGFSTPRVSSRPKIINSLSAELLALTILLGVVLRSNDEFGAVIKTRRRISGLWLVSLSQILEP